MFDDILSHDPIRLKYNRVAARKILSGQFSPRARQGRGLLNPITVVEGYVLDEDVQVIFAPYKGSLFFRKRDNILVDSMTDMVRVRYDQLTSSGLCIKPLYSAPKGFTHRSEHGANSQYTYSLQSIIDGKISFPYFLYTRGASGEILPEAVPILARKVRVHMHGDKYLDFLPNDIAVSEVVDICKQKYAEHKPDMHNVKWGVRDNLIADNTPRGLFNRTLKGFEYDLVDLLSGKSFLPTYDTTGNLRLSAMVVIKTTYTTKKFDKDTQMKEVWSSWKPRSSDTECECSDQYDNLCIVDPHLIMSSKYSLPTAKGLVLKHNVIITWSSEDVLCFSRNTSVEYIILTLHRLNRQNDPVRTRHTFPSHSGCRHSPDTILDVNKDMTIPSLDSQSCLIRFGPSCTPLFLPMSTTIVAGKRAFLKAQNKAMKQKHENLARGTNWINHARPKR